MSVEDNQQNKEIMKESGVRVETRSELETLKRVPRLDLVPDPAPTEQKT